MVDRVVADPVFAMLPAPQVERLTRAAEHRSVPAGYVVVRQGDVGDAYYLIVAGEFAVEVDGRRLRVLGPGEGFGEIALLRDVPRTATVTALGSGELLAVGRDQFLEAVTGHPHSLRTAEGIAEGFVGGHG
jgi:CRP-like cAMP-binding protein